MSNTFPIFTILGTEYMREPIRVKMEDGSTRSFTLLSRMRDYAEGPKVLQLQRMADDPEVDMLLDLHAKGWRIPNEAELRLMIEMAKLGIGEFQLDSIWFLMTPQGVMSYMHSNNSNWQIKNWVQVTGYARLVRNANPSNRTNGLNQSRS